MRTSILWGLENIDEEIESLECELTTDSNDNIMFVYEEPEVHERLVEKREELEKSLKNYCRQVFSSLSGYDYLSDKIKLSYFDNDTIFYYNHVIKLSSELYEEVVSIEKENTELMIELVNNALKVLRPCVVLDGTYWCGGSDYEWRRIKGVNKFLGLYESTSSEYENIVLVNHDLFSEDYAFRESSQNLALVKTVGQFSDDLINCLWNNISHALVQEGIIVSDRIIPENLSFKEITPEEIKNMKELFWITKRIGEYYHPNKFKIYEKL